MSQEEGRTRPGGPSEGLAAFRALFPALKRVVWLNSATLAPASRPVLDALGRAERQWEEGHWDWQAWEREAFATRALFAHLIGGPRPMSMRSSGAGSPGSEPARGTAPDPRERFVTGEGDIEIVHSPVSPTPSWAALMPSVAFAAATVAASIRSGRVVVGEREFRSNLFPWTALRERGVEVVEVPARDGVVRTEDLVTAIADGTTLVAVTEVQSDSGFRVALRPIADRAHDVGARLFVNLTQSLGVLRFDMAASGADYVVAHGYKWLLCPRGAAWLAVRPEALSDLAPLTPGWTSTEDRHSDYYGSPPRYSADASRLDVSLAWFPWIGARAALETLLALDPVEVEERALGLAARFREEAARRGFGLVPQEVASQVVGVAVPDADALRERLAERNVVAAVRGGYLRVGFHGFNDERDLEAALAALGTG